MRDLQSASPDSALLHVCKLPARRDSASQGGRYGGAVRLGLNVGYWGAGGSGAEDLALVREAERLGYSVAWAAEAYGSDAVSVLAYLAGQTSAIDLGSAVLQIPARTPTMTAMTAATMDILSAGRFRLGLGVSGPQVSEGWHGVRFGKPLARTREYVDIVKMALDRKMVRYSGETYQLPLPDGPGKPLHLMLYPVREHIPIYLAAIGPKNLELAGEIADGWQPVFFSPEYAAEQLDRIRAGRRKIGKDLTDFDVSATIAISVGNDLERCAGPIRAHAALYVGGMGSRSQNFYNALAVRMGFGDAAATVQDRYLARDHDAAAAAVPFEFIDRTALLGPVERIADRMRAYAEAGVTTASLMPYGDSLEERIAVLRAAAEALDKSGVAQ
jgi:F420-dependent oxidoreductase-like protein